MKQKILFLDIETSFKIAGVWGRWDQNIAMNQIIQDTHILNWSAKWADKKGIIKDALHYYPNVYREDPTCDKKILTSLVALLNEADYVVGHNLDHFDIPTINGRLLANGFNPPAAFKTIDTLKIAKRRFKRTLSSLRLNDLGELLKVGKKMDTGGFDLWRKVVLKHDKKAFDKMVSYCSQDVRLLEQVYLKLKPWDNKGPINRETLDGSKCLSCGSKHVIKNGSYTTATNTFPKYQCKDCGFSMRGLANKKVKAL